MILTELTTKHKDKAPKSLAICKMLMDTVLEPRREASRSTLPRLMVLIEAIPEAGRGNAEFFVGWFLKNHGDPQNAKKYLERCSRSQHAVSWYRYLADAALNAMAGN